MRTFFLFYLLSYLLQNPLLALLIVALMYQRLKLISFDPVLAAAMGVSVVLTHYLLMGLLTVTIVAGLKTTGVILVVAMVITPASAAYQLTDPNNVILGKHGGTMEKQAVPEEFLVAPGSPRDPHEGVPSTVFRYDLVWEFVSAIEEDRDCVPGFDHGARAQAIADAVLDSHEKRAWVDVDLNLEA